MSDMHNTQEVQRLQRRELGRKTLVTKATTTSKSVRTTIPDNLAEKLGIRPGDALDWEIVEVRGKKGLFARKLE